MELVRQIVLAIEASPNGYFDGQLAVDGHSDVEIGFHVLLMIEGGLIEGHEVSGLGDQTPTAHPLRLTWEGYEFADASRDSTRWHRARKAIGEHAGSVSMDVMKSLLKTMMLESVIPGGSAVPTAGLLRRIAAHLRFRLR